MPKPVPEFVRKIEEANAQPLTSLARWGAKAIYGAKDVRELAAVCLTLSDLLDQAVKQWVQVGEREPEPTKTSIAVPPNPPPRHDEPKYTNTKGAAKILGSSVSQLESMRAKGGGPKWLKIGRVVRYHIPDLHAWAAERKQP